MRDNHTMLVFFLPQKISSLVNVISKFPSDTNAENEVGGVGILKHEKESQNPENMKTVREIKFGRKCSTIMVQSCNVRKCDIKQETKCNFLIRELSSSFNTHLFVCYINCHAFSPLELFWYWTLIALFVFITGYLLVLWSDRNNTQSRNHTSKLI